MGLFRRHRAAVGGGAAPDAEGDLVEVAVLERWRSEAAVETLRNEGIRAAALDAHGRRGSWSGECSAELAHEQRMTAVPTARIVVHHGDAARARRVLCELVEE